MSRSKGNIAEQKAYKYLKSNKFEIIDRNFYAKKFGEIDIITKKNNIYQFYEVKSSTNYETALNNLNTSKIKKIKKSIDYYIQLKNLDIEYTINAIIISDDKIDIIENITF